MLRLFEPMSFPHGAPMKNRLVLAPLTNLQSHPDGILSDDEYRWLTMRAKGGFGLTMTCGAYVDVTGKGFPGQLGISSDNHVAGLTRLAAGIKSEGSLAVVQLLHAGARASQQLTGQVPVGPSDDPESGARAMSTAEVEQVIEDFIAAAVRAKAAGFDGVELHGAHGYLLCAFLSAELNRRADRYGGSAENRARPIHEMLAGIRQRCGVDFSIGLRLSAERFGIEMTEMCDLAQQLMTCGTIDYLDLSLWDAFKEPADPKYQGRSLMSYFTALDRGRARLGVAGKIRSAQDAKACLDAGADFVLIGAAAIFHHDFPTRVRADSQFRSAIPPVSPAHLEAEGATPVFIEYLKMLRSSGFLDV